MNDFVRLAAETLKTEHFTLADIGCSGGIDPVWREFGDRFSAVGFDASISECRRLAAEETNPGVRYVSGFVDIPPDHPFARYAGGTEHVDTMYGRFSAAWMMDIRAERLKTATEDEKFRHNMWRETELADRSRPIFAPQVLADLGHQRVDLLKIDIDGPDFRVLNSFDGMFEKLGILGARLEVCMFGSHDDRIHAFHNTDRFMRRQGYALVALDNRTYSMRALPACFAITMPAQTVSGRPFLADAFYARDPAGWEWDGIGDRLSAEQLIKLAAIYSVWAQPDSAAEILLKFRDRLAPQIDVDAALDVLAAQTQAGVEKPLSYGDYMASFATDSERFFPDKSEPPPPPPPPRPTFLQRLRAAWVSVTDWPYIEHIEKVRRKAD